MNPNLVRVNHYYVTPGGQLRKVTGKPIVDGRRRVSYLTKSIRKHGKPFSWQGTMANPPFVASFASKCERRLTAVEVQNLRVQNILLPGE